MLLYTRATRWLLSLALALAFAAAPTAAQQGACSGHPDFHLLDFWIGEWRVESGGTIAGHNRIERILDGCAVQENWVGASGGEGRSLFYYVPVEETWKQVWVTSNPFRPGGVKEKTLVERLANGGVRFQGTVSLPDGRVYLDRTTLSPESDGTVRQLLEVSTDEGISWRAVFDGRYVRTGP